METDLKRLLKRVVELVMPDLRAYYRMPHKAKILKSYPANGKFYADVQPLHNNEETDESKPILTKLEIPVLVGGKGTGIIGPPSKGTHCVLSYFDGDPNFPYISDFRWKGNGSPECELEALIIQKESGVFIKLDSEKKIKIVTSADIEVECVKADVQCEESNVKAGTSVTIDSKKIEFKDGDGGVTTGVVTMECNCNVLGVSHAVGSSKVFAQKD